MRQGESGLMLEKRSLYLAATSVAEEPEACQAEDYTSIDFGVGAIERKRRPERAAPPGPAAPRAAIQTHDLHKGKAEEIGGQGGALCATQSRDIEAKGAGRGIALEEPRGIL